MVKQKYYLCGISKKFSYLHVRYLITYNNNYKMMHIKFSPYSIVHFLRINYEILKLHICLGYTLEKR